jgi:hypothetical protein
VDTLTGPAVVLDADDCVVLGRQLVDAIRLGYTSRGRPPPEMLLDFASKVNTVARASSARFRMNAQASPASGTGRPRPAPGLPRSDQPVRLTATEAAKLAEVSVEFMRRCLRAGDPHGSRGHRSAWLVDTAELAAWISRRRRENERKAA